MQEGNKKRPFSGMHPALNFPQKILMAFSFLSFERIQHFPLLSIELGRDFETNPHL
jgi:hypothetical protein